MLNALLLLQLKRELRMIKRNTGSGEGFKPIAGFVKLKKLAVGDAIAGTYTGQMTTKGEYPKLNHLIELAQPLTYVTYKEGQDVQVTSQAGEVVALETTTVLTQSLSMEDVGKPITIVFDGQSKNKKQGQRPAYLASIYDGLPNSKPAEAPKVAAASAGSKASGFPFTKA